MLFFGQFQKKIGLILFQKTSSTWADWAVNKKIRVTRASYSCQNDILETRNLNSCVY
jgi:hypothetical protein